MPLKTNQTDSKEVQPDQSIKKNVSKKTATRPPLRTAGKPNKKNNGFLGNTELKTKKTAQQTVPFENCYRSGIIESRPGYFSKSYQLIDVNFRVAPQQTQEDIFHKYEEFINSFDSDTHMQITINNRNIDEKQLERDLMCRMENDGLDDFRQELNGFTLDRMKEGKNNLISDKYLTIGIALPDVLAASSAFTSRIDKEVNNRMRAIMGRQNITIPPMKIEERVKCFHDIYNIGNEQQLPDAFDIDDYISQGMSVKDIVAPPSFKFYEDYFKMGDKFGRALYLKACPTSLSTDFIADISDLPFNLTASIQFEPIEQTKAIDLVKRQMVTINANVVDAQKRASKEGYAHDLISPDLRNSQEQAEFLMDDIRNKNQKLFFITMVIIHYADSLEQLKEDTKSVTALGNRYLCAINKLHYQQEVGLTSALPLADNRVSVKRLMKTESAALFIPFNAQELMQKDGMCYGVNALTRNLLMFDRSSKEAKNPNGLILGLPGSGKSMMAKIEIINVLLTKPVNNQIYILDPEAEYVGLAKALSKLGAAVVHMEAGSGVYINPFDMDLNYGESDEGSGDPVTLKSDYICVLCETAMSRKYGLSNAERSIIDRCVRALYQPYIKHIESLGGKATMDVHASPTMDMFYEKLMQQKEPEAHNIALAMEIYCKGSFDCFSRETNVDINKRLVVYDIKDIGTGLKEMGLQVCLNHVWNKVISNKAKGIRTWIYIDEFHILTKSEASSGFVMQIWKRARKWNGVPCAITQNLEDLLKTESSRALINNTEFVIMLSQSAIDRNGLKELLKISDAQLEFITNSPAGQGLIYNGQTIVPFENKIPEDSKIYRVITTRASDKKAG